MQLLRGFLTLCGIMSKTMKSSIWVKWAGVFLNILLLVLMSCSSLDETEVDIAEPNLKISYGTSFVECLGYCTKTIEASEGEIKLIMTSEADSLPTIVFTKSMKSATWDSILSVVDVAEFAMLDNEFGCPDCADGGAEWIAIKADDIEHKVTFEYANEPEALKSYAELLRSLKIYFEK